jgi:hypothetical protein
MPDSSLLVHEGDQGDGFGDFSETLEDTIMVDV